MEKIITTLHEYFDDSNILELKHPFENIIFVESGSYVLNNRLRFSNCNFRNCEFKSYSACDYSIDFLGCTFENCVFYEESIFASFSFCTFINNSFPNGFKSAFNESTSFLKCDYDDSFLELWRKEMVCPVSGEFVGWKKAYLCKIGSHNDSIATKMYPVIIKLLVPEDSKRSSALSNKCRCEKAMVLEVQDIYGYKIDIPDDCFAVSMFEFESFVGHSAPFDPMDELQTRYIPGEMVYADSFDPDPLVECGGGIHFFTTREEAVEYVF